MLKFIKRLKTESYSAIYDFNGKQIILPDEWKDFLSKEVLMKEQSVSSFISEQFNSTKSSSRFINSVLLLNKEFRSFYSKEEQIAISNNNKAAVNLKIEEAQRSKFELLSKDIALITRTKSMLKELQIKTRKVRYSINAIIYLDEFDLSLKKEGVLLRSNLTDIKYAIVTEADEFSKKNNFYNEFREFCFVTNFVGVIMSVREYAKFAELLGFNKSPNQKVHIAYSVFADLFSDKHKDLPFSVNLNTRKTALEDLLSQYEVERFPLKLNRFDKPHIFNQFKGRFEEACKLAKVPKAVDYLLPQRILTETQEELNLTFVREASFDWLREVNRFMKYDAWILGSKILIEIDGQAHYMPIYGEDKLKLYKENDKIKTTLAKDNGFELIRLKLPATSKDLIEILKSKGFSQREVSKANLDESLIFAVRLLVNKIGRMPSKAEYTRFIKTLDFSSPGVASIIKVLPWSGVAKLLDVEPYSQKHFKHNSFEETIYKDSLFKVFDILKRPFSAVEYDKIKAQYNLDIPSSSAISKITTWSDAVISAGIGTRQRKFDLDDSNKVNPLAHYFLRFIKETNTYPSRSAIRQFKLSWMPDLNQIIKHSSLKDALLSVGLPVLCSSIFNEGAKYRYSALLWKFYNLFGFLPSKEEYIKITHCERPWIHPDHMKEPFDDIVKEVKGFLIKFGNYGDKK